MTASLKVLIVDDDPGMLAVASEELQSCGHEVVEAGSGEEALSKLLKHDFALVISDIEMPQMNGLELVRHIRAMDDDSVSNVPIVMLTGRGDDAAIQSAFDCGASSFVQKPVNWLNFNYHLSFILRAGLAEKELRNSHKAAAKAGEARRDLMINLQHELRSPLHVITGYADVIGGTKENVSEDIQEAVDFMRVSALDINTRLSKIFLLSDLIGDDVVLNIRAISPRELFADVCSGLKNRHGFDTTGVSVDLPSDLVLPLDQTTFMKAAESILENALKFGNGKVSVTFATSANGGRAIDIADDGDGFELERASALLKVFGQSDAGLTRESTGLGLGLATARMIVELHGGTIKLDNSAELGGGLVKIIFDGFPEMNLSNDQAA